MKKKETAVQNIAFIALISAINGVMSLFMLLVPFLSILLILVLPLLTALTTLYVKPKYLWIYFIATILLCCLINLSSLDFVIFSILPSLTSGFIFGLMCQKNILVSVTCLVSAFAQFIFSWITIPLIEFIYDINVLESYMNLIKISDYSLATLTFFPLIFALALAQSTLSYTIVANELKKFNITPNFSLNNTYLLSIFAGILSIATIVAAFLDFHSYLFFVISLALISVPFTKHIVKKSLFFRVLMIIGFILNLFFYAFSYSFINEPYNFLSFLLLILMISVYDLSTYSTEKHLLVDGFVGKIKRGDET